MRPGPGLVVMALAFISGARRGSTSSINTKTTTTTTTTSSPPPLSLPTTAITTTLTPASTPTLSQQQTTTVGTSSTSLSYLTSSISTPTGAVITDKTTLLAPTQPTTIYERFGFLGSKLYTEEEDDHQLHLNKGPKEPAPFNFLNKFFPHNFHTSFSSTSNYFTYTYPLPSNLAQYYDDSRTRTNTKSVLHSAKQARRAITKFRRRRRRRRKRRARSSSGSFKDSSTAFDDTTENLNDSEDTLTSLTTAVDSSSDRTTLARGLHVHFPSLTASDTSRSLDEDDIFALVAEDDLLSEESFDHLVKLTNEKIGDTNEEDYSSGTETVVESSSGSGSGAPDNVPDTPYQPSRSIIENVGHTPLQTEPNNRQQLEKQNENPSTLQNDVNNEDDATEFDDGLKKNTNNAHRSENNIFETTYNAHLVGHSQEVVLLTGDDSAYSIHPITVEEDRRQIATTSTSSTNSIHTKAELESVNKYRTILESDFALTRLNPWISACDLAQPGPSSAPDLQGECSAGTLPVARVDEGPGPPMCLKSCKEETPFTNKLNKDNMINNLINNNSNNNNNKNNQKQHKHDNKVTKLVGYITTTNTFNIKLRNSQPTAGHSVNTNDNSNSKNNDNNASNSKISNLLQKLLKPFNYYQINNSNNNNKMPKTRRNSKEISSAIVERSADAAKSIGLNVTEGNEFKDSLAQARSLRSTENYELLRDMLVQEYKAASHTQIEHDDHQLNVAAVAMPLTQQQQQNHNNNDVDKMKTNYSEQNRQPNNQNKQFELKYNHMKYNYSGNNGTSNNGINNKMYQSYSIEKSQAIPAATSITMINHVVAANNRNSDQYLKMTPPEKQQQQCLEYLGDSDTTMPAHLCRTLTTTDRLTQLRHLRLRNCCERTLYSALHAVALNATLSGGADCLRVLEDLMTLDALASRITCGLTEILFRFDCRQTYSIVHQCNDCKEAYRRWVCSTLVPYFAETSDVMKPPQILGSTIGSINVDRSTFKIPTEPYNSYAKKLSISKATKFSNMTTSHTNGTFPNSSKQNSNNNNNNISHAMPLKLATSNFITTSDRNKHGMHYDAGNYQQHFTLPQQHQPQEERHVTKRNAQQQQQPQQYSNKKFTKNNKSKDISNDNKINGSSFKPRLNHDKNPPQQQSTAISPTSQALTFPGVIVHNSWATSPRNYLKSSISHQNINATDKTTSGYYFQYKSANMRHKRSDNATIAKPTRRATEMPADVDVNTLPVSLPSTLKSKSKSTPLNRMQGQKQQQSFNFISTANNEDSLDPKNPVIRKLLKRSKRKEFEFRKRRRIRPCLSVCQTVEQKCPYLLPADRAPSMPTQYAGEPTFLCLDYNIAETKEQLGKASHGPNDCCYTYCSNTADGICTYCDDMWDKTIIDKEADILSEESETKVFNITMKTKGQGETAGTIRVESKIQEKIGEEKNSLKMSTVAIAVRNGTALQNATRLAERLQYYAFCDGVFYYDDDADDMPAYPDSGNCRKLPPVQSRCSIPYYATNYISSADILGSYRKHNEAKKLLIWLSTLLCLWSCYSARSLRVVRPKEDKRQHQQLTHQPQQQQNFINTAFEGERMCQSCQFREIMQNKRNVNGKVITLWYDYRESRILLIYLLRVKSGKGKTKKLRKNSFVVWHLRQIQRRAIAKFNLKILEIPSLILIINYKEILLLLFKKRQKLRKRIVGDVMAMHQRNWSSLRGSVCKYLKSKPKIYSLNRQKIHYYYNYYYCSCSQIFSFSCNKNIINNNYYNNTKDIKKFKYNFSTCNFNKNNTKCNRNSSSNNHNNNNNMNNNNNNNNNNNKNNSNIMMINTINYKEVSIIKFNTTKTNLLKTNSYIINNNNNNNNNNNSSNNNNIYCYNIIIIITISYNIYSNTQKKQIFDSLRVKSNDSHHYYNYYNNYIYYYKIKFKPQIMINNIDTSLQTFTLPTRSSSSVTIPSHNFLQPHLISMIVIINVMMTLKMSIILRMPLLFKSFIGMKYNNNHHMNNIIKLKLSFRPSTSYNSKKIIYLYSYYYNLNISDWRQRRRWLRRRHRLPIHQIVEKSNNFHWSHSPLPSDLQSQDSASPIIFL